MRNIDKFTLKMNEFPEIETQISFTDIRVRNDGAILIEDNLFFKNEAIELLDFLKQWYEEIED